jgi:hypothetical protein
MGFAAAVICQIEKVAEVRRRVGIPRMKRTCPRVFTLSVPKFSVKLNHRGRRVCPVATSELSNSGSLELYV